MKLKKLVTSMLLLMVVIAFNACSDNDTVKDAFVVVNRATGTLYIVNPSTGALTEALDVTYDGGSLSDIRGTVYNKSDKKLYVTSTDDGLGKLYSVNTKTGSATLLNDNPNDHWYGIADLILKDGKLVCTTWHKTASSVGDTPGMLIFNLNGTISETIGFDTEDPNGVDMCCGFGLTTGSSSNELLVASYTSGNGLEIVSSDMDGMCTFGNYLTVEGFDEGKDEYSFAIKSMVKSSGKIYALVYGWDEFDGNTYLAKVDVTNSKLIFVSKLTSDADVVNGVEYHGLAVVPGNLF